MDKGSMAMQLALVDAIVAKNSGLVAELLDKGACSNRPLDVANVTPLHFAAQGGDVDIVELLIAHGASKEAQTVPDGETPRDIAALHACKALIGLL